MKFNLKNRPAFISEKYGKAAQRKGAQEALRLCMVETDEWFEGFEEELRQWLARLESNKEQVKSRPEYYRPLETMTDTIKEVLGDSQ